MSLRDRLRERELPQATVGIRIDTSAKTDEALERLRHAELDLQVAEAARRTDEIPRLREALAEAKAVVDEAFEYVVIKAIPAADFEALMAAHPPLDEDRAKGASWNRATFFPALLAACVEGPETEQDWYEMIESGQFVMGEFSTLISTALELNDRSPRVNLGKGSMRNPN